MSPGERGFSLIESMIAIAVLTIGVVGVAAVIAGGVKTNDTSKFSNIASTLATEKLEDLNRWPASDPTHVALGGSLTADVTGYFDDVSVAADGGAFTEKETVPAQSPVCTSFNPGNNPIPLASTLACPAGSFPVSFDRRWLIESPVTINGVALSGVRRVTVRVQAQGAMYPVIFQMSTVRP